MTRIGVYPGTFDPVTLGHMDIIRRGAKLVDRLVVGVTTNASKSPMFSLDERMATVRREVATIGGAIDVVPFDSLLMDFAVREGASVIVRGLRAVADQRLAADPGRVHHAQVADGGAVADLGHRAVGVQHGIVLDVGAGTDDDRAEVGAQHRAVPDRGALLHGDVTDQGRRRRDPGPGGDAGLRALELKEWHAEQRRRSRPTGR